MSNRRGHGYTANEVSGLLDILERTVPIGNDEWEYVAREHQLNFPDKARDATSLKWKFMQLYRKRTPTGDPTCPPEVRRAKRVLVEIREKAECDAFEESVSDDLDDTDQENFVDSSSTVPPNIQTTTTTTTAPDTTTTTPTQNPTRTDNLPVSTPASGPGQQVNNSASFSSHSQTSRIGSNGARVGRKKDSFDGPLGDFVRFTMLQREMDREQREREREEREKERDIERKEREMERRERERERRQQQADARNFQQMIMLMMAGRMVPQNMEVREPDKDESDDNDNDN
eukprot:CAMPEP_0195282058 /NCGR_PEP_ID=MMETSP0707-20130614/1107_1 /TAXON_ID=33640 /ORGANISM="Asterionellopsis glacialis, Strain CCMP134" /LENGTH=286 /DNA_ID=CAMNT_0040341009 /DNA_START=79 /DNA_END=939 /DNA_ORIENTATION=-